jgi:hypothetical protein
MVENGPHMNRRVLLQRLSGLGLLAGAGWLFKQALFPHYPDFDQQATWRVWIDHLIPEDETPGALSLGIDAKILEKSEYLDLVEKGTLWLYKTAKDRFDKPYTALSESEAESLIVMASKESGDSIPNSFFLYTRLEAMKLYYADPRSRVGTVWEQNPQPAGHPDFQQPCHHA